jgi:plastocyanin
VRSLILVPTLVLLAACGGGSPATGSASTSPPASAASPSPSAAASAEVVTITETEFKLDPATVSVKAGTVTFQLVDKGQAPHDLHIAPKGSTTEIGASQRMQAGGTASLTVTLAPGTYDMWCGVPGHRQAGMQGTVTVT